MQQFKVKYIFALYTSIKRVTTNSILLQTPTVKREWLEGGLNTDLVTVLYVSVRTVSLLNNRNHAEFKLCGWLWVGEGRRLVMHCPCHSKGHRYLFLVSGVAHIWWSAFSPSCGEAFSTQKAKWFLQPNTRILLIQSVGSDSPSH